MYINPKNTVNSKSFKSFIHHAQNSFSILGNFNYKFIPEKLQIETKRIYLGTGQCLLGRGVYISKGQSNKIQKEIDSMNNILKQINIRWKKNLQMYNTNFFYDSSNNSNQTANILKNKVINHFMENCIINNKNNCFDSSKDNQYILFKHKNGSLIQKKINPSNEQELKDSIINFMEENSNNGINEYFPIFIINKKQLDSIIKNSKDSKSKKFTIFSSKFEILSDIKKNIIPADNYMNTSYANYIINTYDNNPSANQLKTKYSINNKDINFNNFYKVYSVSLTCENNFSIIPKVNNSASGVDIMHLAYKNKFLNDPNYNLYSSDSMTIYNTSDFDFLDAYRQSGAKTNKSLKLDFGQTTPLNLLSEKYLVYSVSKWNKICKLTKVNELKFLGKKNNIRFVYVTKQKFNLNEFDVTSFTLMILFNKTRICINNQIIESKNLFDKKNDNNVLNKDNNIKTNNINTNINNVTNNRLFNEQRNFRTEPYDESSNNEGGINCYSNKNYSIRDNSNGYF